MNGSVARLSETKEDMVSGLLEELRLRQGEWVSASEADSDFARHRFMIALEAFNRLVLWNYPG